MASENKPSHPQHVRRAPQHALWYERLIPLVLILLALVMIAIIVIAVGVLVGIIPYR